MPCLAFALVPCALSLVPRIYRLLDFDRLLLATSLYIYSPATSRT